MKKLMSAVLVVLMMSTPCLAEIETDSLFSIEETLWSTNSTVYSTTPPFVHITDFTMGFYRGRIYCSNDVGACTAPEQSFYIDSPVGSIAFSFDERCEGGSVWVEE